MNLICCNVRGINNPSKDYCIRDMINKEKAQIVGLIETKLLQCTKQRVHSLWGNSPVEYRVSSAVGNSSGGLLLMWNPEFFTSINHHIGGRWIIIEGIMKEYDWRCSIAIIYGGHSADEQIQIYSEFNHTKTELTSPMMLMGDFNQILQISERREMVHETQGMRAFKNWLDSLGVLELPLTGRELPLTGRKYTWRRGNSRSKIDRCFIEASWQQQFLTMAMKCLEVSFSDHVALSVSLIDRTNWGPKPF